jgi:hypothetical protein
MAEKKIGKDKIKVFDGILTISPNWEVRATDRVRDCFYVNFKPDPILSGKIHPKEIIVNFQLSKHVPWWPIIFVAGREAEEIPHPYYARSIVKWMAKQEDELTMAYGRMTRDQIGR